MMKKIYIAPESTIVELSFMRSFMLEASRLLDDGGEGDGSDIGAKQNDYDMEEIEFDMWK